MPQPISLRERTVACRAGRPDLVVPLDLTTFSELNLDAYICRSVIGVFGGA